MGSSLIDPVLNGPHPEGYAQFGNGSWRLSLWPGDEVTPEVNSDRGSITRVKV